MAGIGTERVDAKPRSVDDAIPHNPEPELVIRNMQHHPGPSIAAGSLHECISVRGEQRQATLVRLQAYRDGHQAHGCSITEHNVAHSPDWDT